MATAKKTEVSKVVDNRRVSLNKLIDWLDKNREQIGSVVIVVSPKPASEIVGGPNDPYDCTDKCDGFYAAIETSELAADDDGRVSIHVTDRTIGMATRLINAVTKQHSPFGF